MFLPNNFRWVLPRVLKQCWSGLLYLSLVCIQFICEINHARPNFKIYIFTMRKYVTKGVITPMIIIESKVKDKGKRSHFTLFLSSLLLPVDDVRPTTLDDPQSAVVFTPTDDTSALSVLEWPSILRILELPSATTIIAYSKISWIPNAA